MTGLDGPGSVRVFDVFGDENTSQSGEHNYRQPVSNVEDPVLEDSPTTPLKPCRWPTLMTAKVVRSRGKRMRQSAAEASVCYDEDGHGDNYLAAIVNVIGYLRRFQNLTTTEARFSDEFADADSFKENLAVVQLATKTLQHAYGIIATSTVVIDDPAHQHTTATARQTITRRKWSVEDERRLVEMRDCQNLS